MDAALSKPSVVATGSIAIDEFQRAMREQGIIYDDAQPVLGDGHIHRFHVQGDRRGSRNGWYCLHLDDKPAGSFGCNKRHGNDVKFSWMSKRTPQPMSPQAREEFHEKLREQRARKMLEESLRHEAAAARAQKIWEEATPAVNHPYLAKKGIQANGARLGSWEYSNQETGLVSVVSNEALLVPIRKLGAGIVSLQAIFPDDQNFLRRDRDYLKHGEKKGCYFGIGSPCLHEERKVFIICEGYATGASIHEATGHCVIIAFDANNLQFVARSMRERQHDAIILIAADNDQWTLKPIKNPGLYHARKAAQQSAGVVIYPDFDSSLGLGANNADAKVSEKGPTDFNDLNNLEGSGAVKSIVEKALGSPIVHNVYDTGTNSKPQAGSPMEERAWKSSGENSTSGSHIEPLANDLGLIPLGITGKYYGFWKCHTSDVVLIRYREILQEAQLLRLADRALWETWCLDGPGRWDRSYIGNTLIQICNQLGDILATRVPTEQASSEEVNLMLAIAWLIESPSAGQLAAVLRAHPDWKRVGIWRNLMSTEVHCDQAPPCGGEAGAWGDDQDKRLTAWVAQQWGVSVSTRLAAEAIELVANQTSRHPVQEYLDQLSWDGNPRLDTWLTDCAGVRPSPYTNAVGAKTLISAVLRAMEPGSKVDTMLILEGPQGLRKSSLIAALVPNSNWFAEDLGADIGDKDALQGLRGKWIIELAEMANMNRAKADKVKQFLSSRVDRYRPSYGRRTKDFPRQAVFIGTINPGGDGGYLSDPTGGRRFWPVSCHKVDLDRVRAERDQLWAEAVVRYRQGEPCWLDEVTEALAKEEQTDRMPSNPWESRVNAYLDGQHTTDVGPDRWRSHRHPLREVRIEEIFEACTNRLMGARDVRDQKLIAEVLKNRGWIKTRAAIGGRRLYVWRPDALKDIH